MPPMPLALLGAVDPLLRDAVALAAVLEPGTVVVRHDLLDDGAEGRIRRLVSDLTGVVEDDEVPLE
ncbi:MAG TPA: cobalamin biosynthesis protein CobW, partial [Actinotalea sp.]|nr:cobalamin biosynthesis protein CobW [Actinotalea sp.]